MNRWQQGSRVAANVLRGIVFTWRDPSVMRYEVSLKR